MIRINATRARLDQMTFPMSNGNVFLIFGPFVDEDVPAPETLEFRSSYDSLKERTGIFGENHVNHRKLDANLDISPFSALLRGSRDIKFNTRKSDGTLSSYVYRSPAVFTDFVKDSGGNLVKRLSPTMGVIVTPNVSRSGSAYYYRSYRILFVQLDPARAANGKRYQRSVSLSYSVSTTWVLASSLDGAKLVAAKEIVARHPVSEVNFDSATPFETSNLYLDKEVLDSPVPTARDAYIALQQVLDFKYDYPEGLKSPGELVSDAVETLDSNNINMFEFLQGFKNPKSLIPQLKNLSKLKTHASNYLGVQYAILPGIDDLKSLWETLAGKADVYTDGLNHQVLTAGHSVSRVGFYGTVTRTTRLKIAINQTDYRLRAVSERLRDIGFFPSVNNIWELVPYSFVIDWFINIGDILEAADTNMRVARLPVVYSTTSTRTQITPNLPESLISLGVTGDIGITLYSRSVNSEPPKEPLNFEVSNELPSHWLEAGALIVVAGKNK